MAGRTMQFRAVEDVFVVVHKADPPTEQEWEEYVDYCIALPQSCNKTLVLTLGGGPNAKQRNALQKRFLVEHPMTVAVMTDSTMVRGIVTALNWFNPKAKAFPYANGTGVPDALAHLGVQGVAGQRVGIELQKLRLELGLK